MSDWLAKYIPVVGAMIPLFEENCNNNKHRTKLNHQVGLINTCVSLQQFIVACTEIERSEGSISVARVSGLLANILHLQADRLGFMHGMDDEILEVVVQVMYPIVAKCIETMGIDFDGE